MEDIAYLVNDKTRSLYIPVKKVSHSAIVTALNPVTRRVVGKEEAKKLINYTWIMVVREPLDRFNSFYRSDNPGKQRLDPLGLMDDVITGYWKNDSHTCPQSEYIEGLKIPEVIIKYENLKDEFWKFEEMFPDCNKLGVENVSKSDRDLYRDFPVDMIDVLRDKYKLDYILFNF